MNNHFDGEDGSDTYLSSTDMLLGHDRKNISGQTHETYCAGAALGVTAGLVLLQNNTGDSKKAQKLIVVATPCDEVRR